MIAAGLAPLAPERELIAASRLFLREIEYYITRRESFSFETTLSGPSYLRLVRRLVSDGWQVELIYLALPSVEMSALRVAERVAHGGHSVPLDAINRRFSRSLYNLLHIYSKVVNSTLCFVNVGDSPELIFMQIGEQREVLQQDWFELLKIQAKP